MRTTVAARALVRRHPVLTYVVLAYALGWSWCVPLAVHRDVVRMGVGWPTHLPGLAGPALAAVGVTALIDGRAGLRDLWARVTRWRVGWRWWAVVAGTLSLALVGVIVPLVTGGDVPSLSAFTRYSGIGAISPLGVVVVALLANGLGEETGWRGFAADRLLRDHSFRWTALVVAVAWGGWHLPFFWMVAGFRGMGPLAVGWAVGLVAGSVVLTWLYREGHRSVLLVAAWHTAFNPDLRHGGHRRDRGDGHQRARDRLGRVDPQAGGAQTGVPARGLRAGVALQGDAQRIGFVADVEAAPVAGRCQIQDRISGMSSSFAVT